MASSSASGSLGPPTIAALVLALAGTVVLAGAAGAYHLSAGVSDTAATGPEETPTDPSVDRETYERGLARDCYEPAEDGLARAAEADGFCGRLVYHPGTVFEQASPPDQDLVTAEIGGFDVVYANYVGTYGVGTCSPWCFPGGESLYRAGHDAGAQLGLTPTGEEAYRDDQGWQTYGGDLAHPNAARIAQASTGAWAANGWAQPMPDQSFVGFVEDTEGDPIDEVRLAALASDHESLPSRAVPAVCGFTPDADLADSGPSQACEVTLHWRGTGSQDAACRSPTYTCGALTPAWHGQVACWPVHGCQGTALGEPAEPSLDLGPSSSAADYDVWHWVLAPAPSACGGAQEPGFATSPDADLPYLAHDLDVYSPATTAAGIDRGQPLAEAAQTAVGHRLGQAPSPPEPAREPEPAAAELVAKDDRVEPNAPGDSSQSTIDVDRDPLANECTLVREDAEQAASVDPWVDLIDAQVYRNLWLDSILGVDPWLEGLDRASYQQAPVAGAFGDANDAYLQDEDHQDASNRPGPWMYSAGGQVGVFTDLDDDGRYDQAANGRLFEAIGDVGAYPLFWDMRVTEDGAIDGDAGCTLAGERLTQAMAEAGYGPRTGLITAVHKTEPTVLYDWRTSQAFPQLEAGQTYVLLSQALAAQREDPTVRQAIAATLDKLPAEVALDDDRVVFPGEWTTPASDFYEQCGYPTGGFHTSWSFTHEARALAGDTIVTAYVLDNAAADGVLGGDGLVPAFTPQGEAYAFEHGLSQWFDVDPIDGDPDRNTETCSAPPHEGDRC
ncbi:hypothetical protein BRD56_04710 [Thermoplasmatales archaeon SW_10_69_26]|nr:MAG: hypothetical protein BRD56_04710 [Thermoplasmatales archaeon SW_10_69_26]